MPSDTNANGDIFGGWVLSQMDQAGGIAAVEAAEGRVVTVAIEAMHFIRPVKVGDVLCVYTSIGHIGRTSLKVNIEAWARRFRRPSPRKSDRRHLHLRRHRRPGTAAAGCQGAGERVGRLLYQCIYVILQVLHVLAPKPLDPFVRQHCRSFAASCRLHPSAGEPNRKRRRNLLKRLKMESEMARSAPSPPRTAPTQEPGMTQCCLQPQSTISRRACAPRPAA